MDVISLTQALIKFNTINPPGNEEEIAKYIGAILHKEGFAVDYPKYAEGRLNVIATKGLSEKNCAYRFDRSYRCRSIWSCCLENQSTKC